MSIHSRQALLGIAEGFLFATVICVFMALSLPGDILSVNPSTVFVRRFDGGCSGWTSELAWHEACMNIALWYAYAIIAMLILRLHPIPIKIVKEAKLVLTLMVMFIAGCGYKHLLDAYTIFDPVYPAVIAYGYALDLVSLIAVWYVAVALTKASSATTTNRLRLAELEKARADGGR